VISAPSGAGKTTLWQEVVSQLDGIVHSVSMTSRMPRPGEADKKDYFFVDKQTFERHRDEGCFLEWAKVFGNYYGTPKDKVMECLDQGKDVILSIDVQGAEQIRKEFPQAVFVFILPPDIETLRNRLKARGTDTEEEIMKRLKIAEQEMSCSKQYDCEIINDDLKNAVEELKAFIISVRRREGE